MKKAFLIALVALLAVSFVFAQGTTETKATKDGKYSGVKLTYWSMWNSNEPQGKVLKQAVEAFEAETGAEVTVEWKGRDLNKVILSSLEAGEPIDLFDDDYTRIGRSYKDYTYDLTSMAAASDYASKSYPVFSAESIKMAGYLNAIALQANTGGVWYNADIFEACGVKAPTTWAEFLVVCQTLVDKGYEPMALDGAYADYFFGFHLDRRISEAKTTELSLNGGWSKNAGAIAAADDIIDFVKKGYLASGAPDEYPASQNKIGLTGKVAMVVCANYVTSEVDKIAGTPLNWGFFNYPMIPVSEGGTGKQDSFAGCNALAISSYSKNPQAAYDLAMYFVTGEWGAKFAEAAQLAPADPNNTIPAGTEGSVKALLSTKAPLSWTMGLNKNSAIKTNIKSTVISLFEGKYESGKDFCAALDALYK